MKKDIIFSIIIAILGCFLINQCNKNSSLNNEIKRQHNNILAMTDTIHQYKDELGRTVAEKHAYQLTQEELRDSIGLLKQKNIDYIAYVNTLAGIRDTIIETTYIDRTDRDSSYLDNGIIKINTKKVFDKSSYEYNMNIPYYIDNTLHTNDCEFDINIDVYLESWIERNSKTGESMLKLRSDYPNITFNSGKGIIATTTPEYEKSFRKTKGIGINIGPQVGVSYDLINQKIVPTVGIGVGIGFNYTPKKLQW